MRPTARHSRSQIKDKDVHGQISWMPRFVGRELHIRVGATLVVLQGEAEASPTQLFFLTKYQEIERQHRGLAGKYDYAKSFKDGQKITIQSSLIRSSR